MADDQLRNELEALIQAKHEPLYEAQRERLKGRSDLGNSYLQWDHEQLLRFVQTETHSLLPFVESVRKERGETGPLSDDQYYLAAMQRSHETIARTHAAISKAAERSADPRRKEILRQLASNAEADMTEFKRLHSPETLTEQLLDEVTSTVIGRMNALHHKLKPPNA